MRTVYKQTRKVMLIQNKMDLSYVRHESNIWPVYWTTNPRLAKPFITEQALKSYMTALIKAIAKAEAIQAGQHPANWKEYKYKSGDVDPFKNVRIVETDWECTITASDTELQVDMEELFIKPLFAKKMGIKYTRPNKKVVKSTS